MRKKKNTYAISPEERVDKVYDYMYKIEEKLNKTIKILIDMAVKFDEGCKAQLLQYILDSRG